ncbi:methyltransferase [Actinoplanes sp. GCM10030250]|uniref:methyltransferase n=1 Tax=Actinoplanes sp. GCM10030250 TaxID=3273376 RepID=UPI00360BE8D9
MAEDLWAVADLVTPMAIRVAATLRLADHIDAGRKSDTGTASVDDLATATGTDPDALRRLMDHLVTAGVLTPGWELTALGEQLRDDHPGRARAWLDMDGAVGHAELSFVELLHSVRTGEPAFPRRYGVPYWDDLAAHPGRSASFDALMGSRLTADAPAIAGGYPWGALGHVVDVGGGSGDLLIAILSAHAGLRGTVVDLPGPVARAEQAFAAAGLGERAGVRAGSFFDPLPAGAGGYILSGVVHDWDDERATTILRRCAEASGTATAGGESPDGGKVLVVDTFGIEHTAGDLRMLCYVGGRERTLDELTELAATAGLRCCSTRPAGSRLIVEFTADPPGPL